MSNYDPDKYENSQEQKQIWISEHIYFAQEDMTIFQVMSDAFRINNYQIRKHREDLGLVLKMQRQDFFQCHFFRELKRGNFIKGGSNFEHKNHEELHQRGEKTFSFFYIHSQETLQHF